LSSENKEIRALEAVEQKSVYFLDDELIAVRAADTHIYVAVRQLCGALGLDRYGQVQRIQRQKILANGHYQIEIATPGGGQVTNMLRVDLVPLWLSGINTRRIKDDAVRKKLEKYQEDAAKVLWEAFQEGRLTTDLGFDDLLATDSPAVQAYKMLQAMVKLARTQILIEAQIGHHTMQLGDHEQRLEDIESTLGDTKRNVTPEQASQISQAVKAVAMVLSKSSGSNQYGSVYGELYRKFGITSYKLLPVLRFDEAMKFLTEWHQSLVGDEPF
jgi:ferritin-like metal-binding protein YciE